MAAWIDFRELRSKLSFEAVLKHYGVEVKIKGKQHHGFCPLPEHNGTSNSQSFSANLEKGIFQCFGCGAKGNLLDFAVLMEGMNPKDGTDVRKTALKLREAFGIPEEPRPKKAKVPEPEPELFPRQTSSPEKPVVVNAPLDFELKNLDPRHTYLDKRGFTRETIEKFGLGYCNKGLLKGRVAIPLQSADGKLIGYAGRAVEDTRIGENNPKYRFPAPRERDGTVYEFHKSRILYNAHRISRPAKNLILVEGFPSVWWLDQMCFPNSCALMDSACSDEQAQIIRDLVSPDGTIWIMSDASESGKEFASDVFRQVALYRFVRWAKLDPGKKPTDYPGQFFRDLFR